MCVCLSSRTVSVTLFSFFESFPVNFARIVPDGLLVFFPSYYLLDQCISSWKTTVRPWNKISGEGGVSNYSVELHVLSSCRVTEIQVRYGKEYANSKNLLLNLDNLPCFCLLSR